MWPVVSRVGARHTVGRTRPEFFRVYMGREWKRLYVGVKQEMAHQDQSRARRLRRGWSLLPPRTKPREAPHISHCTLVGMHWKYIKRGGFLCLRGCVYAGQLARSTSPTLWKQDVNHGSVAPSILRPLAKDPSVRASAVTSHLLLCGDSYNALDKERRVVVIRSSFDLSFAGRDGEHLS